MTVLLLGLTMGLVALGLGGWIWKQRRQLRAQAVALEEIEQRYKHVQQKAHTESKSMEKVIEEHDEQVRLKLNMLLQPEMSLETEDLSLIFDFPVLQRLLDEFSKISGMVTAVLDLKGKILLAAGWQDICTRFHRVHPETSRACTESDLYFSKNVAAGAIAEYKCKNGLWDMVTPLMIGDKKVGNVYTGQFFYDDEIIDRQAFIDRARRYGFDQDAYLAALDRVPRVSREQAAEAMAFLADFTAIISQLSFRNIQLARLNSAQQQAKETLEQHRDELEKLVAARTHALEKVNAEQQQMLDAMRAMVCYKDTENTILWANKAFLAVSGRTEEELQGRSAYDLFPEQAAHYYEDDLEVIRSGRPKLGIVERMQTAAGDLLWVMTDKMPMRNEDGQLTGLILFMLDITDSKRAQQALERRSEELRTIVQHMAGREKRMVELKKIVKKLSWQLEEAGMVSVAVDSVHLMPEEAKPHQSLKEGDYELPAS